MEVQALVHAITVAELSVLSPLNFVHDAARGTMFRESTDPPLPNKTGVLMHLGRRLRDCSDAVGFTTIV